MRELTPKGFDALLRIGGNREEVVDSFKRLGFRSGEIHFNFNDWLAHDLGQKAYIAAVYVEEL